MNTIIDHTVIAGLRGAGDEADLSFLWELVGSYLSQAPALAEEIKHSARVADVKRMERAARKLKGQSLALGAVDLGELCGQIETKARNNDLSDLDSLITCLEGVLEQTGLELKKQLEANFW